jgi:hypothetical protein
MIFQNPPYMASRHQLYLRIAAAGTSFNPLPCQAWHGYMVTSARRVEVEVGVDGPASAPLSGAAAAAPHAGARCRRCVNGRAQCNRLILVQLRKHVENPLSSSLPACRNSTCTEPRREACITCTCTNFGPQNMDRKSNVCAHGNWGVPRKMSTSVNNAPWCAGQTSAFYPLIELHGHRGSVLRVIKCAPLVLTDFMGRVYLMSFSFCLVVCTAFSCKNNCHITLGRQLSKVQSLNGRPQTALQVTALLLSPRSCRFPAFAPP